MTLIGWICSVAGSWILLASLIASGVGRSIKLADRLESPAVGAGAGKASPDSGARHLRIVR